MNGIPMSGAREDMRWSGLVRKSVGMRALSEQQHTVFMQTFDSIIPINPNFIPRDIQIQAVSIQLSQICYPWKMQENDLPVVRTSAIKLDQ